MKRYIIIKNKDIRVKLANGFQSLNISSVPTSERKYGLYGATMDSETRDKWFQLEKGPALFKWTSQIHKDNHRGLNEIVCSGLAKQIGIACADYDFAHFEDKNKFGVVSYKATPNNVGLLTVHNIFKKFLVHTETSINSILSNLYAINKNYDPFEYNEKELEEYLFQMIVFDYLVSQCDRHLNNIHFEAKFLPNGKYKLSPAPLIDNERAFGLTINYNFLNIPDELFCEARLSCCQFHVGEIKTHESIYKTMEMEADDILKFAIKDKTRFEWLKGAIKKIDANAVIDTLIADGNDVSENYRKWVNKCIKIKKNIIAKEAKKMLSHLKKESSLIQDKDNDNSSEQ